MKRSYLYKLNSVAITLLFCISIYTSFILGFFEKYEDISANENRSLATLPSLSLTKDGINKFPKLVEEYYSDRFGLRDWFVKCYNLVKYNLGDSPSDDVTLGKDGWLFLGSIKNGYSNYSDPIGDARNINLFSDDELKKFAKYMTSINAWLSDRGIIFVFVIAPDKHTIYFEKLPVYISKVNKYSATDQVIDYLHRHTNVPVVDLRAKLIESKNKYQLYYKTDTHWNHSGANIAQYEIMREIKRFFPKSIKPQLFELKNGYSEDGDLARLIGVSGFKEYNPLPIFKNTCQPSKYPKNATYREPYSYSCKGQQINVLVYRDSFFEALIPYFARKFRHSTYVWEKPTLSSLKKYVDSEHPDIVIEEWAERDFPYVLKFQP